MKLSKRILLIAQEFFDDIPEGSFYRRLYHGHHQRSAGAWSWMLDHEERVVDVGSQWNLQEIAKAHKSGILYRNCNELCVAYRRKKENQSDRSTETSQTS